MKQSKAISAAILKKVAEGMTLPAAFDAVLGNGAYSRLVSDLYDAFNQKGGAK